MSLGALRKRRVWPSNKKGKENLPLTGGNLVQDQVCLRGCSYRAGQLDRLTRMDIQLPKTVQSCCQKPMHAAEL